MQDEEQSVAGVRDDNVKENCMRMFTAIAEYPGNIEIGFLLSAGAKVNDGPAVVVMDVAGPGAPTDGTGLPFRFKLRHVGVQKRF